MKKQLLTIITGLAVSFSSFSQTDTISDFFTGTPTLYGLSSQPGYLSGNNGYGDLQKMQLFDATHGVSTTGTATITGVTLGIAAKTNAGGSFQVAILADNAGTANTASVLATKTVTIASVDTTSAAYGLMGTSALYNLTVYFDSPLAMPSTNKFWATVILPTTAGDTIALFSNTDGDFADAATHSAEIWSDGSFYTIGDPNNWDSNIAFSIYPVVHYSQAGVEQLSIEEINVYPNPANNELNISMKQNMSSVSIMSADGKVISTQSVNGNKANVNVTELNSGVYFYSVVTENGATLTNTFVKK